MRRLAIHRMCLVLALALVWPVVRGQNMLPNGDFETAGKNNSQPDQWSPWMDANKVKPAALTQNYLLSGGHNNSKCIQVGHSYEHFLQLPPYNTNNYARFRLDSGSAVTIDPNGYYKFSVWYKTQNIDDDQCSVEIDFYNGTTYIDSWEYYLPPAADWTQYTTYFVPIRTTDRGFQGSPIGANAVRIKLGVVSSLGTALYDDVDMEAVTADEYTTNYPLTNFQVDPLTARRTKPTWLTAEGMWSVQQDGKKNWWFVRPNGQPVWLRAMQNLNTSAAEHPAMFAALPSNYKDTTNTNDDYARDSMARVGAIGFNSGAITDGQTDECTHPKGEAYFQYLPPDPGTDYPTSYLLEDKNGNYDTANKPMPDPYNPDYQQWLTNYIRTALNTQNGCQQNELLTPDFAGYWTDNEMGVENLDEFLWSPYNAQHFENYCKTLYNNDPAALNAAWSSQYAMFNITSFDDLLTPANEAQIIRHHIDDPLYPVLNRYIIDMLKDYYKLWCGTIREYECEQEGDSNGDGIADHKHLIASNRFAFSSYPYRYDADMQLAITAIAELNQERPGYYFDFIAVNDYPGDADIEGIVSKRNFAFLEQISQQAGLPVMVSEFAVHGRDCGFPTGNNVTQDVGWYFRQVNTQADRGMMYDKMVRQWASSPYIMGAQWWQWADLMQSTSGSTATPVQFDNNAKYRGRNCGIVDQNNNFYTPLTNQMALTNAAIDQAFLPATIKTNSAADPIWLTNTP